MPYWTLARSTVGAVHQTERCTCPVSRAGGVTAGTSWQIRHLQGSGAPGSDSDCLGLSHPFGHVGAASFRTGAPPAQPQAQNACGTLETPSAKATAIFRACCIRRISSGLFKVYYARHYS